jgi:hypothetical protein
MNVAFARYSLFIIIQRELEAAVYVDYMKYLCVCARALTRVFVIVKYGQIKKIRPLFKEKIYNFESMRSDVFTVESYLPNWMASHLRTQSSPPYQSVNI